MAVTYTYANSATHRFIAQELISAAQKDNLIFKLFPIKTHNRTKLRWTIKDNFRGLMKLRGLGGEPTRVNRVGENTYEAKPGVFGEFTALDEDELTNREGSIPDSVDVPISVDDMIKEDNELLMTRYMNRLVQMGWALLNSGTLSIILPGGGVGFLASYTQQTYTPSTPWTTVATATPLKDLMRLPYLYGRGTSTAFDSRATAYANSRTLLDLQLNTNAADLGGKKVNNGGSITSLAEINTFMLAAGAPKLEVWDGGYEDESGTFQMDIPDGTVHIIGARPDGSTLGEIQMTKNANNPNKAPGLYHKIVDFTKGPYPRIPPVIHNHMGFNGGHVLERPRQHVKMIVGSSYS